MSSVEIIFLSLILITNFVFGNVYGIAIISVEELEKARDQYKPIVINTTIPVVDYGYLNGQYIGPQLNPITISQAAMKNYDNIEKSKHTNKTEIVKLIIKVDWLLGHAKEKGDHSVLEFNFDYPKFKMEEPWISGMAQAQAMQALIKAHNLTDDDRYLNLAEHLLDTFFIEVKDGGVTYKDANGWWYEEYASPNSLTEPRVLNGMGYALLGLHDYFDYTDSSKSKYLFEKGLQAFTNDLHKYDTSIFSLYDLSGHTADKFYHSIHLELLDKLYEITQDPILKEYYDKWKDKL